MSSLLSAVLAILLQKLADTNSQKQLMNIRVLTSASLQKVYSGNKKKVSIHVHEAQFTVCERNYRKVRQHLSKRRKENQPGQEFRKYYAETATRLTSVGSTGGSTLEVRNIKMQYGKKNGYFKFERSFINFHFRQGISTVLRGKLQNRHTNYYLVVNS